MPAPCPQLSGVVVAWRGADDLQRLFEAWPPDPRFELVVVNNSPEQPLPEHPGARILEPGRNLGFAGGLNLGIERTQAPWVLLLNPDARPTPGALESLLAGAEAHPDVAGIAPRLVGPGGDSQFGWQLRELPSPWQLLGHTLFLAGAHGPREEPPPGAAIEQPAAAALLLRRDALEAAGGLDAEFHPAWFEDVDLARRLHDEGSTLRYWPDAVFEHRLGSTVSELGYGRFLWIYDRNLVRYLHKHHGPLWSTAARLLLPVGLLLRLLLLPLRRSRRASSRSEAARGLAAALAGSLTGWRRPAGW